MDNSGGKTFQLSHSSSRELNLKYRLRFRLRSRLEGEKLPSRSFLNCLGVVGPKLKLAIDIIAETYSAHISAVNGRASLAVWFCHSCDEISEGLRVSLGY